jgi:hypothetical protein
MYATKASFMEYHASQISQEHWSIQHPLRSPRIAPPQWKIGSAKLAGKFTEAYLAVRIINKRYTDDFPQQLSMRKFGAEAK